MNADQGDITLLGNYKNEPNDLNVKIVISWFYETFPLFQYGRELLT